MFETILNKGFFRLARNISFYSSHKIRVGAVISRKKPISIGFNIRKTHPRYSNPSNTYRDSIHAEMAALIRSGTDNVKGADIYIYRETDNGVPALARPCEMCYNMLKQCGIRKIFYSINIYPYWRSEKL